MLEIRQNQMSELAAHMMRQYENRVMEKLAKAHPDRCQKEGEEKIRGFIQAVIQKGDQHGISEDRETELYILLAFAHGIDFENAPGREECRRILQHPDLPGDAKVNLLEREFEPPPERGGSGAAETNS